MELSRRLRSTALILCVFLISIQSSHSRFPGNRPKRQNGAHLFLSASSITPGGDGDDPNEWSEWSSPSECSRSCGGGVSYQTRECLRTAPNGAPLCSGGNRKYLSCNTQDCPEEESDFRSQQCSRFNHVPFDGVQYDWIPYTNAPNPCELNCMPVGERFYYRHKPKVIDGTRCNDKDLDVCVDGECQPVGCDMMLGSDAKEDKCRKCGGDGSTCRTISDTYQTNRLAAGYNDILLIPSGATNIRVQETVPSNNYLACRNLTSHYYLNGNWRIDFPRPMFYAGSWWTYQRKPNGFAAPDLLTCSGPTTESIYIVMLVQDKNISIDYEYSIPDSVSQDTPDAYTWTHMEFDACSVSCGGGTQSRTVTCNNRITLEEVDASLCDAKNKPSESQECGKEPCAPNWVESEWGKCSKGCGKDGMQNRTISCERISPNGERTQEEDSVCLQLVGNKPANTQECNRDVENCPKYHLGPWTPCDKLCGDGKQTRKVTCYIEENGRKKVLNDEDCVEEKPETEKPCLLQPCEGVDWIISQWSGCEACGQNVETRTAICGSKTGQVYPEEFCAPEVPLLTRPCKSKRCKTQWFTSEWSECSTSCGKGVQSRIVLCGEFDGKSVTPASDDSKCNTETKPETRQDCDGEEAECPGQWFTGPWSSCSKPCGGGERVREVLCLANGTKSSTCDEAKLEAISEKCNSQACTEDEIIPVDSTSSPIETTEDETDDDECSEEEEDDDELDIVTDKMSADLKISEGIDLDDETTTTSSFITDELMLSDAPSSTDIPQSTVEGSGDETESTDDSSLTTEEGSGDDDEDEDESSTISSITSDGSSTDLQETTVSSDVSPDSSTDASTDTSTDASTDNASTDSSVDTSSDSSTDLSAKTDVSEVTESSVSTESSASTESTDVAESSEGLSLSTESSSSTDAADVSENTSDSTDITPTGSSVESSTDVSSSDSTIESTSDSSSLASSDSTESTSESSTDSTSDETSTISSSSLETEATETTSDTTNESSTELSTIQSSTDLSASSSDSTSDSTSDSSTTPSSSDSTETTNDATDDNTTEVSGTGSESTEEQLVSTTTESLSSAVTEITDSSDSSSSATDETNISESTELTSTDSSGGTSTEVVSTESSDSISTDETTNVSEQSTESSATEESSETSSTDISTSTESSSSTDDSSTDTSISTEEDSTVDIWSTTDFTEDTSEGSTLITFTDIVSKDSTRKCKARKPKKDCKTTEHGCCPDNKTAAKGPFDEGCPAPKTCADTKFGCCLDGVSPAKGKKNKGCPKSQCAETLFGCCPDKFTPADGEDNEGCPIPTTLPPTTTTEIPTTEEQTDISEDSSTDLPDSTEAPSKSCSFAEFGCCPDGKTEAKGKEFLGCEDVTDCTKSSNGCCPDNRTPASGPNGQGCAGCTSEPFGCCPDGETPSHGPLGEGCCLNSPYGCCPDNINSARGPNFEDCECRYAPYGCCPDTKTAARGPNNEGCGCETTQFGCCPDKLTSASGPKFEGCACHTMQFGCCPDGLTFAQGPHHYGCHCSQTEFKCCDDEKTPAKGANQEGCTCVESKFGCCPDGISVAQGDKFEGCENVKEPPQKACGLPKETGPCGNFSIKYFFDTSYGACARFWYGGCDGNGNKFETEGECKEICQEYTGKEACHLPKSSGPCTGSATKWYFDADRNRCEEFKYGGCYGTNNRFDTLADCQSLCTVNESIPPCDQPVDEGPCEGTYERWAYDNETDVCRPFTYGGCKGNKNNYPTEYACNYGCRQPGVHKDFCSLPKQTGDCSEQHARWYYEEIEKKCLPFYYTGCGGNKNNFPSLESCEDHCPREVAKTVCEIPAEVGECTNYAAMWYYDTKDERCRQFYYGGCGGNENRFQTEDECLQRCEKKPEPEPPQAPPANSQIQQTDNVCAAPAEPGDCRAFIIQWYFDRESSRCRQFYYGGCGGNNNRFQTEGECSQRCENVQPAATQPPVRAPAQSNICQAEADIGDCDNYVLKWHYDVKDQRCGQFYYGGCGGNENRFETEEDCNRRCAEAPAAPEEPEPPAQPEGQKCYLPAERGDCNGNQTRWYYNSQDGLCDEFNYSGCGGNENNYESEDECQNQCHDVQTTCSLPPIRGRCNDNTIRWYFDERSSRCYEFEFTGCRGNRNNFVTERECLSYCGNEDFVQPSATAGYSVCELPAETGECENNTAAWFYDSETLSCTAFTYSGCGGNGNRFETKEQCDRQCGDFKGVDVCNEPVKTGPCRQWQTRYYYNKESGACDPFTYGGCDGTGNRFTDRAECESVCIVGQEPIRNAPKDICKLPLTVGRCSESTAQERRWYYDEERGNCISFIYSGCSGNQNNFRDYESCYKYCTKPEENNEIPGNELQPCARFEDECRQLRCPFGVRRSPTLNENNVECSRCDCENPCERYPCPEGQQCAVEISSDTSRQFVPLCRDTNKPGACPQLLANGSDCARECYTDADCRGDNKCCSDGCGFVCVRPAQPTHATSRPTTATPLLIYPGEVKAALEPKQQEDIDVNAAIGGVAVLRCFATGSPPPNVTWSRQNVVIDTSQGRYVLTSSGDLTIVQVRQTDTGSYVCVASNGLGEPVRRTVDLAVSEPKNISAYIYGGNNLTQIVTLNQPAQVRCPAGGHPAPHVSWWRNRKRLGLVNDRFELLRDYSLMLRSVQLSDLGPYNCEVWNGHGHPSSMKVTLKAIGPARALNNDDAAYLQYIIDPATIPSTSRPSYPYRPTRPSVVPPVVVVHVPPRPQVVSAQAVFGLDPRNSYSPGSTIVMSCAVQGYPTPTVTWTKDSLPLLASERIQITAEPHRLVINDVTTDDTGLYGCTARNSVSYNTAQETITIKSDIPVHPECIDNPHFANCQLIVKGHYCRNHYYSQFCCRSCTLAGQIATPHPNAV